MDSTLQVFTARISTRDPDRFDITRKSGGETGHPFAPPWPLVAPIIAARRDNASEGTLERLWSAYVPAYLAEMRTSYRANRAAWDALLARPRVVLCCYCTNALRCHRYLLAEHILAKLGATARGEIP